MSLDDGTGDRQAEAGSVGVARRVGPAAVEGLEDPVSLGEGNPLAGVGDLDLEPPPVVSARTVPSLGGGQQADLGAWLRSGGSNAEVRGSGQVDRMLRLTGLFERLEAVDLRLSASGL